MSGDCHRLRRYSGEGLTGAWKGIRTRGLLSRVNHRNLTDGTFWVAFCAAPEERLSDVGARFARANRSSGPLTRGPRVRIPFHAPAGSPLRTYLAGGCRPPELDRLSGLFHATRAGSCPAFVDVIDTTEASGSETGAVLDL